MLVVAIPCWPRNPWTVFSASKSDTIAKRVDEERSERVPMLKWAANHARSRTSTGRITLLEDRWRSAALNLERCLSLIDLPHGVTDDTFPWTRGDQCMLGQSGADSGEPIQASTA